MRLNGRVQTVDESRGTVLNCPGFDVRFAVRRAMRPTGPNAPSRDDSRIDRICPQGVASRPWWKKGAGGLALENSSIERLKEAAVIASSSCVSCCAVNDHKFS